MYLLNLNNGVSANIVELLIFKVKPIGILGSGVKMTFSLPIGGAGF